MITVFFVTLTLTGTGIHVESRELIGFGGQAGIECIAKKRQHEITRQPPTDSLGIAFFCDVIRMKKGEEV